MNCPDCGSAYTTRLQRTTNLSYALFRCQDCCRTFNERTGTPFNFDAYRYRLSSAAVSVALQAELS